MCVCVKERVSVRAHFCICTQALCLCVRWGCEGFCGWKGRDEKYHMVPPPRHSQYGLTDTFTVFLSVISATSAHNGEGRHGTQEQGNGGVYNLLTQTGDKIRFGQTV